MVKAYKVFNNDWTCRGFQYEVGETYEHDGKIELCEAGFHACIRAIDCFNYYKFDNDNKVAEVELLGEVINGSEKSVCSRIKIVRKIEWDEVLQLVNTGKNNTGNRNSGSWNSGNWNSGNRNSGERNSGNRNSGNWNSGERNSGYRNSGYRNSGDWNSGYRNSGNWNSGDRNSGDRNSGERNFGDWNSGYQNSGNRNSGDWNSGDWNSGYMNSNTPRYINVFDKPCKVEEWDNAYKPDFLFFEITKWVPDLEMTQEEKDKNPSFQDNGGYLKVFDYKEAFKASWNNADKYDRVKVKQLPNFDKDIFFEISGIDVDE